MQEKWAALGALTLARTAMGLQFQSVAALAPQVSERLGLSPTGLGVLIGLYLLPGILVALPGGWLGARYGERRLVLVATVLMAVGGATAIVDWPPLAFAGRAVAGIGGVILNVLVTKMVADRFVGPVAPAAMGILIMSWPLGLALAMVLLPPLQGVSASAGVPALLAALCIPLVLVAVKPDVRPERVTRPGLVLPRRELAAALAAGGVWAFYNAGIVALLAFGAVFLVAGGMEQVAAARATSLVAWLIIPSLVAGGWLAGRVGRPDTILTIGLSLSVAVTVALALDAPPLASLIVLGLVAGPGGPLIMLLPARVVPPERRAVAMGLYFTCYYIAVAAAPPLAGALVAATGAAVAPLWLAALCFALALICMAAFRRIERAGRNAA